LDVLRFVGAAFVLWACLGCQITYYMHSAYNQSKLVQSRKPIEKVLKSGKLNDAQKAKLELVNSVKKFSEEKLGLKKSSNYTTFVQLDEPYVTYIVQAAYPFELKPYQWKFPFVGKVPYKGYFKKALAEEEARLLKAENFDVYTRGVSAYSTLGWFQDSVLSSMLRYDDYELVELIIHETVHTTLFIKDAADFNERLATFLGRKGMLLYYNEFGGEASAKQVKMAEEETADQKLFSAFLTVEVEALKKWYLENKDKVSADAKATRLKEIQARFTKELRPKMKTKMYEEFEKRELNNAILLAYSTYEYSLEDFDKVWKFNGEDFGRTLEWLKGLEKEKSPEQKLKDFAKTL
jgi:predicted aminopeptidase